MLKRTDAYIHELSIQMVAWYHRKQLNFTLFNIILVFLFLLRSAGYFNPYFPITVNFIIFFGLVLAVFLLNAKSKAFIIVALLFWIFAGFLRVIGINVWAERTAVYSYQAFLIATVVLFLELFTSRRIKSRERSKK